MNRRRRDSTSSRESSRQRTTRGTEHRHREWVHERPAGPGTRDGWKPPKPPRGKCTTLPPERETVAGLHGERTDEMEDETDENETEALPRRSNPQQTGPRPMIDLRQPQSSEPYDPQMGATPKCPPAGRRSTLSLPASLPVDNSGPNTSGTVHPGNLEERCILETQRVDCGRPLARPPETGALKRPWTSHRTIDPTTG